MSEIMLMREENGEVGFSWRSRGGSDTSIFYIDNGSAEGYMGVGC